MNEKEMWRKNNTNFEKNINFLIDIKNNLCKLNSNGKKLKVNIISNTFIIFYTPSAQLKVKNLEISKD